MKKWILSFLLIFNILGFNSLQAQFIVALDNAANYVTWSHESNGGFGFSDWNLWTEGSAGHFLGSSNSQGFGNIDTDGNAFGMWGNPPATEPESNFSHAQRLVSFWGDGATFSVDIAVAFRNGNKGIDLWGPGFELLWNFNVGSDQYFAGGSSLNWSYSQSSIFKLTVTQNGDNLDISLVRGTDSYSNTINDKSLHGFKFYNGNTDAGNDLNNLFFNNLKVEYSDPEKIPAAANVQIDGNVELGKDQTLTVNNLTIPSGNSLTIKSESDATGSLIVNGTFTGEVTVERYISRWTSASPDRGWHFLSSPVANQAIRPEFVPNTNPIPEYIDFYKWDESHVENSQTGWWINVKDNSSNWNIAFEDDFVIGRGYLMAYGTPATKDYGDKAHEFTGVLNINNVSFSNLSTTTESVHQGWHLLGNPFSSAIQWNNGDWALSNVDANSQIWRESSASYVVIEPDDIIPAMNGFMVRVSESTNSLTIPASARTHNSTSWYKNKPIDNQRIVLNAIDHQGATAQQTIIRFNEMATEGYDTQFDSYFLSGFAPRFYSISQNEIYALNTLPELTDGLTIPLGFVKNSSSEFSIELQQSIEDQPIYLIDLKTDTQHKLSDGSYHFVSSQGDNPNRFLLKFSAVGIDEVITQPAINAWVYNNTLYVNNLDGSTKVEIIDLAGRILYAGNISGEGLQSMNINQPTGVYLVRMSNAGSVATIKAAIK